MMRLLCKDCKYYVIKKPDDERYTNEDKLMYQKYLCSHPDTVQPVNGEYHKCSPLEKALRDARQILSQYKKDMGSEEIFVLNNTLNCFISNSSNRVQLLEKHNGMFPGNDAS